MIYLQKSQPSISIDYKITNSPLNSLNEDSSDSFNIETETPPEADTSQHSTVFDFHKYLFILFHEKF